MGETGGVILGTVATCRTVGVTVQAYLAWAFERVGTHRDLFDLNLAELTPAAFKSALGDARSAGAWRDGRTRSPLRR